MNTNRLGRFSFVLTLIISLQIVARADITNNLVAYWKFDELAGDTAFDSTTNAHDAVLQNFPDDSKWVSGRTNGAINLNAGFVGNQYGLVDDSTNGLNFATMANPTFTLSAWVRGALGATQTNGSGIISKGIGRSQEQYTIDTFQNSYRFYVRDSAGVASTIQLTPAPSNSVNGLWQHIVGVFDSTQTTTSNRVKLYINGLLTGQVAGPTTLTNHTHAVSIGSREDNGSSGYNLPWTGKMDDVRIYNRALSAADVLELFQAPGLFAPEILAQPTSANRFVGETVTLTVVSDGSLPLTYQWKQNGTNVLNATNATLTFASVQLTNAGTYTVAMTNSVGFAISSNAVINVTNPNSDLSNGLLVYLKLDETTGLTAADSTANAHDATLNGFPGDDSQWVPGRTNNACSFTNSDYASILDDGSLDVATNPTPAFSISLWSKAPPGFTEPASAGIIAKGNGGGDEQFAIDVFGGVYRFFIRDGAGVSRILSSGVTPNGAWQHLVAVYNHTNAMNLYVNGQLVATLGAGPGALWNNNHEITIGARQSGSGSYDFPFTGTIDDVHFYNRALTPAEAQLLYASVGTAAPTIVTAPVNTTNLALASASLSVIADGTVPLSYQWRQSGTNVLNATNATLTFTTLQTSNTGAYTVVITNLYGSITTAQAFLQVLELATNDITTALTVWWPFSETSGTVAHDASSFGVNNAQLYNFQFAGTGAQWGPGRVGGALHLNAPGTEELDLNNQVIRDDYIYTDTPISFPYDSNFFTIAFWIKTDKAQSLTDQGLNPRIIAWPSSPSAGTAFGYWRRQGGNSPAIGPVEPQRGPVPDMSWKHFAIAWNRLASTYTLFVNGVYATNFTCTARAASVFSSARWLINHNENLTLNSDAMAGWFSDFRIYNRLLTTNQVAALYAYAGAHWAFDTQPQSATVNERDSLSLFAVASSSTPGPISYQWRKNGTNIAGATTTILTLPALGLSEAGTYSAVASNSLGTITSSDAVVTVTPIPYGNFTNDLIALWTFDETNGLAAADSSGNGNNASLLNFTNDNSQWVPGIRGGALRMNATSPLSVGNNLTNVVITDNGINFPDPNNFSFSFWLKRDPGVQGSNPRLISPATIHWVLWRPLETSGAAGLHGVGLFQPSTSPEPVSNVWTHFVCVVDRLTNVYSLCVNGVRSMYRVLPLSGAGGTVSAAKAAPSSVIQWVIGHAENINSHVDGFRGSIDDMRIYNRQLNLKDVEALNENYNQPPSLQARAVGSAITLTWPSWASDFQLQSADALPAGPWANVTNVPVVVAFTNSVTLNLQAGNKFYRLRRQLP